MSFADHFSTQAKDYAEFRPRYPQALFDYLHQQCSSHDIALDIATGSGQALQSLSPRFNTVIGCEPSFSQLEHAMPLTNGYYINNTAELLPVKDQSVDLVTVAQAVHWFNHARFNKEADRVLKPGGILASWGYSLFHRDQEFDAIIQDYYHNIVGPYWPQERVWIERHYEGLPFPYSLLKVPAFAMHTSWNRHHVIAYLGTWSATQAYIKDNHTNPLPDLERRLSKTWPEADSVHTLDWPIFCLIGRKP